MEDEQKIPTVENLPPPVPPKQVVWIKCRAHEACEGNQAEIVFNRQHSPATADGGFTPVSGGRSIRYRCLTCKNAFHVNS